MNNITKENVDHINLPKPISEDLYEDLFSRGVLRKEQLIMGKSYYGSCRNANIAKWDGSKFIYNRTKFGSTYEESINHLSDDDGYDLFIPIEIHEAE